MPQIGYSPRKVSKVRRTEFAVASPLHPGMVLTKPLPAQLQRRIIIIISRPLDAPAHAHGLDHAYLMPARHESPSGSLTRQAKRC